MTRKFRVSMTTRPTGKERLGTKHFLVVLAADEDEAQAAAINFMGAAYWNEYGWAIMVKAEDSEMEFPFVYRTGSDRVKLNNTPSHENP